MFTEILTGSMNIDVNSLGLAWWRFRPTNGLKCVRWRLEAPTIAMTNDVPLAVAVEQQRPGKVAAVVAAVVGWLRRLVAVDELQLRRGDPRRGPRGRRTARLDLR